MVLPLLVAIAAIGAILMLFAFLIRFSKRVEIAIIGLLLFSGAMSLGSGYLGFSEYRQSFESADWTETSAEILDSRYETVTTGTKPGLGGSRRSRRYILRYEFEVDGVTFEGSRLGFGSHAGNADERASLLERFNVGSEVPVFYNPVNPSESTLTLGGRSGAWFFVIPLLLFGYVFIRTFSTVVRRLKA